MSKEQTKSIPIGKNFYFRRVFIEKSSEKKKQKKLAKAGREKDELEFATNWRRVFQSIFINLKWLNAYGSINFIAC